MMKIQKRVTTVQNKVKNKILNFLNKYVIKNKNKMLVIVLSSLFKVFVNVLYDKIYSISCHKLCYIDFFGYKTIKHQI